MSSTDSATAADTTNAAAYPEIIGRFVADCIPGILAHQTADGSIIYDPKAPIVYPQQALFPLAFSWAGLDPAERWSRATEVADCIRKLSGFLLAHINERGEFFYDSYGHKVTTVDQRLLYAWVEALRILRDAGGDFDFERWSALLCRGCETLIEHRIQRLQGITRFVGRYVGTGMNHVALYLSLLYRAGVVLNRPDFVNLSLPIARALAADVHPDGYWEEHGDLLRTGGPTNLYNALSHGGMALMAEWTDEPVFRAAVERSTHFHGNFSYPDATPVELFDERVRAHAHPFIWGIFGFTNTAEGRGTAIAHFNGWRHGVKDINTVSPELLARCCESYIYWNRSEPAPAPFERRDHCARLILPAGVFRRNAWFVALSCMSATNAEDPAYRDNGFALERQKLVSIWHEKTGLLLDGSHSRKQLENSTFSAPSSYAPDYYPCGGTIGEERGEFVARAAYKTFYGNVHVRPLSDSVLELELSVDPVGNHGPFTAGFTLMRRGDEVHTASGNALMLGKVESEAFVKTSEELGGAFTYGLATISGPAGFKLHWPLQPFNQYAADHTSDPSVWQLRVSVALTPQQPRAIFRIEIA